MPTMQHCPVVRLRSTPLFPRTPASTAYSLGKSSSALGMSGALHSVTATLDDAHATKRDLSVGKGGCMRRGEARCRRDAGDGGAVVHDRVGRHEVQVQQDRVRRGLADLQDRHDADTQAGLVRNSKRARSLRKVKPTGPALTKSACRKLLFVAGVESQFLNIPT